MSRILTRARRRVASSVFCVATTLAVFAVVIARDANVFALMGATIAVMLAFASLSNAWDDYRDERDDAIERSMRRHPAGKTSV